MFRFFTIRIPSACVARQYVSGCNFAQIHPTRRESRGENHFLRSACKRRKERSCFEAFMPSPRSSERRLESYFSIESGSSERQYSSCFFGDCISSSKKYSFAFVFLDRKARGHIDRLGKDGKCNDVEFGSTGTLRHCAPVGAAPVSSTAKLHVVPSETHLKIASEMLFVDIGVSRTFVVVRILVSRTSVVVRDVSS